MIRRPPISTRPDTLVPYTPLCRSAVAAREAPRPSGVDARQFGFERGAVRVAPWIEEFEFEQVAQPVDLRPEGLGRIAAVGVAQLEQRQLDHRAVEEMMRDAVAVIARHRMMRGLHRIDGLAARREKGQEAAGDEGVERRRERRVVAAFEFASEAGIAPAPHPLRSEARRVWQAGGRT